MKAKHTYKQVTGLLLSELSHNLLSPLANRQIRSMIHLHSGLNFFTV